ncbi:type III secretion system inner rod subunit SctI [Sodalis ligni]|uniref:type III secretion system inner rod subunit SctI n=1 Tax=Sodalis ligni TaxID=2697027 RepID=UPI00193FB8A8|nr:type III secretion system inner rod subunit SctI [Sodalis ligni]QWA10496.1 type III secretion system inner rod subunit SctI [Sodalis ligni]
MPISSITEVNHHRAVDINPATGEATSINDIIKETMAKTTADIHEEKQDITRMMKAENLADPAVLGSIQKSMLIYSNTVAFIGTAARKIVGTAETLLRSS